jgi:hypothetical protein
LATRVGRGLWPIALVLSGCAMQATGPETEESSLTTIFGNVLAISQRDDRGDIDGVLTDRGSEIVLATLHWDSLHSEETFRAVDPRTQAVQIIRVVLPTEPELEQTNRDIHDFWQASTASVPHRPLGSITVQFIDGVARSWFTRTGEICTVLEDGRARTRAISVYDSDTALLSVRFPETRRPELHDLAELDARPDVQSMANLLHALWADRSRAEPTY